MSAVFLFRKDAILMLAFLSSNSPEILTKTLSQRGIPVVTLPPFSLLQKPVASHADMLLLACEKTLFVHKDYAFSSSEALKNAFGDTVFIDEPISSEYPHDILLNIAIVGGEVFANVNFASKTVLSFLEKQGKRIHNVKQGYAHCSTCIVNDKAIITADVGIANAAQKAGIDVLKISSGNISLSGYDHGFIGGASGYDSKHVYFCGSLEFHPDGESIKSFCQKHGKIVVELSSSPLVDVGGILFVE